MAEEGAEDFSSVPLLERFASKNWKARKSGYEEAAKLFEATTDEYAADFQPFLFDPDLMKGAVADTNVAAQQDGIACLNAYLKYGGREQCRTSRAGCIPPMVEKGLSSMRAQIKTGSLEALLLYIELDVAAPVVELILPTLGAKQPKVVAATFGALTAIVHEYGCQVVDPKPILKTLPKAFGHADKNVRAEATKLAVELYRWLREAMKPMFWADLKPTQQGDLEKQFEAIKAEGPPKQERLLRSQQTAKGNAPVAAADEDAGGDEYDGALPTGVDAFDLAEPQDVARKIPGDFYDSLASVKWKERKEALEGAYAVLNVPRIQDGDFGQLTAALAKCMKDANILCVIQAAACIELLAKGLRNGFAKYQSTTLVPVMDRLKEKKANVQEALGHALDAIFVACELPDLLETVKTFLGNKNPQVKDATAHFLVRCLTQTKDIPTKAELDSIVESGKKLLSESTVDLRNAGAEILGVIMKMIGERPMGPYLEGLDDIRKTKIREHFDTAEVKAKPKQVKKPPPAAASRPGAGPPKKIIGGGPPAKKPTLGAVKKPLGLATPAKSMAPRPVTPEIVSPVPKPTARPAAAGSRLGLAKPSGIGGLKPPQKRTLGLPSPRRPAAPPVVEDEYDEPVAAAPQPRLGLARGGLAGRSLAKPAASAVAVAPSISPPQTSGLSSSERAELEELRAANDRLLRQVDDSRHEKSKLMTEVQELKNQNADLIENHTRDVLSIKAKETQLVRARSDAEAAEQTNERLRRELERLKKALNRAEAAAAAAPSGVADMGSPISTPGALSPMHDDAGIYRDVSGGMASPTAGRPASAIRNRMSYQSAYSEEKENGGDPPSYTRTKFNPENRYNGATSAAGSHHSGTESPSRMAYRPTRPAPMDSYGSYSEKPTPRTGSNGRSPDENSEPVAPGESWKRAAAVTSQLKARIEQMKAKQGMANRQ